MRGITQPKKEQLKLQFRRGLNIGAVSAEDDSSFLEKCFVDAGYLEALTDTQKGQSIIVGRTGAGKSALIQRLTAEVENCTRIEPDELAFAYISNSTIIRFFDNLGVNLDAFYQLLWKHVFCVELIRMKYKIKNAEQNSSFWSSIQSILDRDERKKKAVNYLREWGDKFWLDTEVRIREITQQIESKLKAAVDGLPIGVPLSAEYTDQIKTEIKKEIRERSQKVTNELQIRELHEVINLLSEDVFTNAGQDFFVVIDDLDKSWVNDPIRYKLIRALIEAVKKLRKIKNAKIVAALRTDLLDKVLDETREAGFQHEKYEDSYLRIHWTPAELGKIVDLRVNHLIKSAYTKSDVSFYDVFPFKIGQESTLSYLTDRTQLRPRDMIMFINNCLEKAAGGTQITSSIIKEAEVTYSKERFQSACQEWGDIFPTLSASCEMLRGRKASFRVRDLSVADLHDFCLELATVKGAAGDPISIAAIRITERDTPNTLNEFLAFLSTWAAALYRTGVVGIRPSRQSPTTFAQTTEVMGENLHLEAESKILVHPMYWNALGVRWLNSNDYRA